MWAEASYKRFNCANMPVAFRECRHACGYCRLNASETDIANYDYKLATDPISCHNPSYGLAFHKVDFKKGLSIKLNYIKKSILVFQRFEERFARYIRMRKMRQVLNE